MTDSSPEVLERRLEVINRMGIHARPATKIVEMTNDFQASVTFSNDEETVDGKSIFGVMTLAAVQGTTLTARAEGTDAEALLDALEALFRGGFEETGGEGEQETSG